jgi:hypothetical protein
MASNSPAASRASYRVLPQALLVTRVSGVSQPILSDLSVPLFEDRNEPSLRWYLPQAALVFPAPAAGHETSPFLFQVERIGSGASGRPAIRARLRFTLTLGPSDAAAAAIAANPAIKARMIEPVEPSVTLSVPFIGEASGKLERALYYGVTTRSESLLQVTVELLNDAARTTYGSLSTPEFQPEPTWLDVEFQFSGYAPVLQKLSVGRSRTMLSTGVRSATGRDRESPAMTVSGGRMVLRTAAAINQGEPSRTDLERGIPPGILDLSSTAGFAVRTMVCSQSVAAFVPCAQFGAFYREKKDNDTVAIGCSDAYRLTQASSRTYEEVPALDHPSYRVFRNLQQPGRFVVVARTYAITRHEPGKVGREYRPALTAYAALDESRPANNRFQVEVTLGPAISPYEFALLNRRLLMEAQNPLLEFPNLLAHHCEFQWNVPGVSGQVVTSATEDHLQVSFATDLAGMVLLKTMIQNTGLSGDARFTLSDGSVINSALSIHLARITGPWPMGPLATERRGKTVQLTNRIEAPLTVTAVHLFNGADEPSHVPVGVSLARDASLEIVATSPYTAAVADFITLAGGNPTFEEVRAMIADLECHVVFIDLVEYETHRLVGLAIEARLRNVPGVLQVPMANRRGSVTFLMPLTTYVESRVIEYRVTKTFASKVEVTGWLTWQLDDQGNVVSIQWGRIESSTAPGPTSA